MSLGFVRVSDTIIGSGSHGAPCCGHNFTGVWLKGAATVLAEGLPVIRAGSDMGVVNCPHCKTFIGLTAVPNVIIEGAPQHPIGGVIKTVCGLGVTVSGATTVI